jgi:catecholate siderophore receptor
VTRNIEGGAKRSWAGGRVTTTASIFRLDRTNIKTTDPLDPTRLVLVGRQRSDGFELALDGALTPRWFMHASFANLDATILRSNSVLSGVPIEGNRPGLTPRQSGSLWTTMDITPRLTMGGGIAAMGDRFTSNDNLVRLPAHARVDAVASYRVGRYTLSLNVQNLCDARYYESAGGNFQIYPGAPRHALLTARYSF